VLAPKGTPRAIVEVLDRAVAAGMAEPKIEESFSKLGVDIVREGTPETFSAFLAAQLEKWGDLARDVGAKVE
jgi:tripartite-type tricarboxylate transporter receptor subunit TctC